MVFGAVEILQDKKVQVKRGDDALQFGVNSVEKVRRQGVDTEIDIGVRSKVSPGKRTEKEHSLDTAVLAEVLRGNGGLRTRLSRQLLQSLGVFLGTPFPALTECPSLFR
nr:hypothetical protein [Caldinitratiruptor microaerophilus]